MIINQKAIVFFMGSGLFICLYFSFQTLWSFDSEVTIEDSSLMWDPRDAHAVRVAPEAHIDTQAQHQDLVLRQADADADRARPLGPAASLPKPKMKDIIDRYSSGAADRPAGAGAEVEAVLKNVQCLPTSARSVYGFYPGTAATGVLNDQYCDCAAGTSDSTVSVPPKQQQQQQLNGSRSRSQGPVSGSAVRSAHSALRGARPEQGKSVGSIDSDEVLVRTDEPRTSACSLDLVAQPVFQCGRSSGGGGSGGGAHGRTQTAKERGKSSGLVFIFASRVWDGVCDCCDGSDESDGPWGLTCPNTCHRV